MAQKMPRPLVLGPLPPPFGGARVSFQLFFEYLAQLPGFSFQHFDVPVRNARNNNPPGGVNHPKTIIRLLHCLSELPFSGSVVVFGSKGFCFSYGLVVVLVSRLLGRPCYIRFFGGHPMLEVVDKPPQFQSALLKLLSLSEKVLIETEVGAREFPSSLRHKIEVVPAYRPRSKVQLTPTERNDGTVRFIYAGGVSKVKGIEVLLAAFSEARRIVQKRIAMELHIYGAGPQEIVQNLNSRPGIYYHGTVDNAVLRQRLPFHDVFVFPTIYSNEGQSGVLAEALLAGVPIITSDLPGPIEVVENRSNGLLVKAGDVEDLAEAMVELANDPILRSQLSEAALLSAARFDAELVLPKLAAAMGLPTKRA
jgi:glycosyltransferase involved in cell wall biosynthesis